MLQLTLLDARKAKPHRMHPLGMSNDATHASFWFDDQAQTQPIKYQQCFLQGGVFLFIKAKIATSIKLA